MFNLGLSQLSGIADIVLKESIVFWIKHGIVLVDDASNNPNEHTYHLANSIDHTTANTTCGTVRVPMLGSATDQSSQASSETDTRNSGKRSYKDALIGKQENPRKK